MAIQVKTEVIDVKIDYFDSLQRKCTKVDLGKDKIEEFNPRGNNSRYLKFYTSLIGEDSPHITNLPCNYIGDTSEAYRYDWLFGLSCIPKKDKKVYWDWKSRLRDDNSLKIQFLFEPQSEKPCIFVNIICANLLCLNPSKNTSSGFEKYRESISNTLNSLANSTKEYSKIASDIFNVANALTNFIASDDNGKNWYLYKFLDQEKNNFGIEWNINKKVLDQFGPMLQGSLVVNFHGSREPAQKLKLHVRPFISFYDKDDLCFVSPYQDILKDHYIEINLENLR